MKTLVPLGFLFLFAHAKLYRFDYEWSEDAGGWLKYHVVPATWDEARLRCHAEGAVLASPLTDELKKTVIKFVRKQNNTTPRTIFTGVHATFSKGDYSSVEGVPLLRLAVTWAPGQPDNYDNSESCLEMYTDLEGHMADTQCSRVLSYVCYKKYTRLHMTECGTTDRAYILDPRTRSCYKFHETGLTWSQAYMTCVAEGGHLVVIKNNREGEVIKDIFSKHPENTIHAVYRNSLTVGFHDWGSRGARFMTIHGQSLEDTYNNWAEGEPDNYTSLRTGDTGQYCGSVFRSAQLDDFYCNVPAVFLCEKKPDSLHDPPHTRIVVQN